MTNNQPKYKFLKKSRPFSSDRPSAVAVSSAPVTHSWSTR